MIDGMLEKLQETDDFKAALMSSTAGVQHLLDCTGACIVHGTEVVKLGVTPTDPQIRQLVDFAAQECNGRLCTNSLATLYPPAKAYSDVAAGCLLSLLPEGFVTNQRVCTPPGWACIGRGCYTLA